MLEFTEQKLTEIEKRAASGGFTFMWPSEAIGMVSEIRKLRKALDEAEWTGELALIALETESADRSIGQETAAKINARVNELIAREDKEDGS